jgi:protocatechuate 3,4-dioxygenase beta subunit
MTTDDAICKFATIKPTFLSLSHPSHPSAMMLHQVIPKASHVHDSVSVSYVRKVLGLPGTGSLPDERAAALVQPLLRLINQSVALDGLLGQGYKDMVADLKTCLDAQVRMHACTLTCRTHLDLPYAP